MALLPRPRINEFVFNNPGADANEYIEVQFNPTASLAGYYLVVLDGDAGAPVGRVNNVISLGTTNAAGYFVTGFTGDALVGTTPLQNGTQTLLLVEGGTPPAINTDFDANNDGVIDGVVPWTSIIDAVAVSDGGAGDIIFFAAPVLSVTATIGGYSRIPDGTDTDTSADWLRNDFDLAGLPGITGTPVAGEALNTPGAANQTVSAGASPGIIVSPTTLSVTEGGANAGFTVVLATQPSGDVTVALSAGNDLVLGAATLTFTASNWNVAQTVSVAAFDDALAEGAENATVTTAAASSTDPNYAGLNASDVAVAIADNDAAGFLLTPTSLSVTEGGAATGFSLRLTSQPSADVVVVIAGNADVSLGASTLTFTAANWNLGQTVAVSAIADGVAEGTEVVAITASATSVDALYNGAVVPSVSVTVADAAAPAAYTLQILHYYGESGLLGIETAPIMGAMIDRFRASATNTLVLGEGDSWIPGPWLVGGADPSLNAVPGIGSTALGRPDVAIMNAFGTNASALGNHEFDLGSPVVSGAIAASGAWVGAQFPLITSNLTFAADSSLRGLADASLGGTATNAFAGLEASAIKGKIAPYTVVTLNGERIGIVGATTYDLLTKTSPNGTVPKDDGNPATDDLQEVAAYIQVTVDALTAAGINKIVMVDQLDTVERNKLLAPLVTGIDVMVAGGGHERLGDATDTAVGFNGHTADFVDTYPLLATAADGRPTLIVTTDTEYTYLGRLQLGFDAAGVIQLASLDPAINGAYAATEATLQSVYGSAQSAAAIVAGSVTGAKVAAITGAIDQVVTTKDGNKFGFSAVYLEGDRVFARAQETNLGNITADANAYTAGLALGTTAPIFSLKNGGGLRASLGSIGEDGSKIANPLTPTGNISQLDVENALRFDNKLMVMDLTAQGLLNILNYAAGLSAGNGGYAQVGGIRFSYDPTLAIGSRVRNVAQYDLAGNFVATVVRDGAVVPGAPALIQAVILSFTANGGDGYPVKANATNFRYLLTGGTVSAAVDPALDFTAAATLATVGATPATVLGEQKAFEDFLETFHGTQATAYNQADTPAAQDLRIQNLAARLDAVIPVATVINEFVFNHTGTDTAEYIEIKSAANADLSSYRLVVIEGDRESASLGAVVNILSPGTANAAGYWVSAFQNNQLQNGTQTLLLVRNPSGLVAGQDLDTNNDGVLDVTPWAAVVDAVAVSDGGATDLTYLGAPVLTPAFDGGTLTVGGASRLPDGVDSDLAGDWARNDFTQVGAGSGTVAGEANNTPGAANAYSVALVAGFQVVPGAASVTEGGATASIAIRLTKAPTSSVTISVTGSADVTVGTTSLTFTAANWSSFQTVTIAAVDDLLVEGTEVSLVTLGAAVSADPAYSGLNPADVTVSVIDNEPIPQVAIHTIQGAAHVSPLVGQTVRTSGIVTARDITNSGSSQTIGFWIQDPNADGDIATSEAIFVFTGTAAGLPAIGDAVTVTGTVFERPPANNASNLATTRLEGVSFTVQSSGNALPLATLIGTAGRVPPKGAIYNDAPGSLNAGIGDFDPVNEGIDFFESLEGMRVAVSNAVVVGGTNGFGETWVLADLGAGSAGRSVRGGVLLGNGDDNPERIQLQIDSGVLNQPGPQAIVNDRVGTAVGIMSYDFGNYEVALTEAPVVTSGRLTQEKTSLVGDASRLTIAEFNVENLDPSDTKFDELARLFADHLKKPDILALQEIQDSSGPTNNGVTDATLTAAKLIAAIFARTGLVYSYADIAPGNNSSGGEPGGNIRNAYLYNTARVQLVPGSLRPITDTAATPGDAFNSSRQPLAADFRFNNQNVTLINVHSSSKGGSGSLYGAVQPAVNGGEAARIAQATEIKAVVDGILAANPTARIGVMGDFNEFAWNPSQQVLTGGANPTLFDLATLLAANDRYSYVFDGSTQQLDHTLGSAAFRSVASHDIVHINAEFADATRVSDHDPSITRLTLSALGQPQSPSFTGGPADATGTYLMAAGGSVGGGAGADILIATAGTGSLVGGLGADLFTFINGLAGGAVTIADFTGADHLSLQGFAANAVANAVASQVVTGAGTSLALADGTQVFLTGVSGVSAASFI